MIEFKGDIEVAGFIPHWLNEEDPDGAVEQLHKNYGHGGGWRDTEGWSLLVGVKQNAPKVDVTESMYWLDYEGDPLMPMRACGLMREELVIVFDHGYVAVVQSDFNFRVARMD